MPVPGLSSTWSMARRAGPAGSPARLSKVSRQTPIWTARPVPDGCRTPRAQPTTATLAVVVRASIPTPMSTSVRQTGPILDAFRTTLANRRHGLVGQQERTSAGHDVKGSRGSPSGRGLGGAPQEKKRRPVLALSANTGRLSLVEVAGIEPASSVASSGLLRVQLAVSLLGPTSLTSKPV